MQINSCWKKIGYGCCLLLLASTLSGCGNKGSKSAEPMSDSELAPVTTIVGSYGDIELPIDMVLDAKNSMIMSTDSFQGGVHAYKGRLQMASLKDYITSKMHSNKWKRVGENASYSNVMLAFTKPNRTCMVVLSESSMGRLGNTYAKFYVTVDVAAASRLNPFGEPISQ